MLIGENYISGGARNGIYLSPGGNSRLTPSGVSSPRDLELDSARAVPVKFMGFAASPPCSQRS